VATETLKPCAVDYRDCIICQQFEECTDKEFVVYGKLRLWRTIYLSALFAAFLYLLA